MQAFEQCRVNKYTIITLEEQTPAEEISLSQKADTFGISRGLTALIGD